MPIRGFDTLKKIPSLFQKKPFNLLRDETLLIDGTWFLKKYMLNSYKDNLTGDLDFTNFYELLKINTNIVWIWSGVDVRRNFVDESDYYAMFLSLMEHSFDSTLHTSDNISYSDDQNNVKNSFPAHSEKNNLSTDKNKENCPTHNNNKENLSSHSEKNQNISADHSKEEKFYKKSLNTNIFIPKIKHILKEKNITQLTSPSTFYAQALFFQKFFNCYVFAPSDFLFFNAKLINNFFFETKTLELVYRDKILAGLKMGVDEFVEFGMILGCEFVGTHPFLANSCFGHGGTYSSVGEFNVFGALEFFKGHRGSFRQGEWHKNFLKAKAVVKYSPVMKCGGDFNQVECLNEVNDHGCENGLHSVDITERKMEHSKTNENSIKNGKENDTIGRKMEHSKTSEDSIKNIKENDAYANEDSNSKNTSVDLNDVFGRRLPDIFYEALFSGRLSGEVVNALVHGDKERNRIGLRVKLIFYAEIERMFGIGIKVFFGGKEIGIYKGRGIEGDFKEMGDLIHHLNNSLLLHDNITSSNNNNTSSDSNSVIMNNVDAKNIHHNDISFSGNIPESKNILKADKFKVNNLKGDISKVNNSKGNISKGDNSKIDISKGDISKGNISKGDICEKTNYKQGKNTKKNTYYKIIEKLNLKIQLIPELPIHDQILLFLLREEMKRDFIFKVLCFRRGNKKNLEINFGREVVGFLCDLRELGNTLLNFRDCIEFVENIQNPHGDLSDCENVNNLNEEILDAYSLAHAIEYKKSGRVGGNLDFLLAVREFFKVNCEGCNFKWYVDQINMVLENENGK